MGFNSGFKRLNAALGGQKWQASLQDLSVSAETSFCIHDIGDILFPRTSLNSLTQRNISYLENK